MEKHVEKLHEDQTDFEAVTFEGRKFRQYTETCQEYMYDKVTTTNFIVGQQKCL